MGKHFESKRKVLTASRIVITLFQIMVFGCVWFAYYNFFAFRSHRIMGGIVTLFLYYIIYDSLARLYKAFKVGQFTIGETLFSQLLSFGIVDLIMYVECCLIARGYVNILPGFLAVLIQLLGTAVWAVAAKKYYMEHVPASETVLIYGDDDVDSFQEKLEGKYSHLFHIRQKIQASEKPDVLYAAAEEAETVILYRVGYRKKAALMRFCTDRKKTFYVTPTVADIIAQGYENRHFIDNPLMKYEGNKETFTRDISKRIMDITISLLGLIITLPITLVTMLAIKIEDGGSIFYTQERYTKDWKKFKILKFRSMVQDAEKNGELVCKENDNRVTKVGSVIRRFRIDEIPQLLNVLKGDMSLVGPRPERVENMEKYTQEIPQFSYRLRVKSGLTGYAQLYGKYNTPAYDKLRLDLIYIENQSFVMDLKLILLTFKILFTPESTEGFSEEAAKTLAETEVFGEKVKGVL